MHRSVIAAGLLTLAAASQAASPKINVGPLFDYMPSDSSQLLKRVRNSGDATAYVRVEVTEMHYAEDGSASESPVDAVSLARNENGASGLIASPARMIIPATNGQQATRLVYRGQRDAERYYRVRYVPVVPDTEEFSLDDAQKADYKNSVSAGVNVFTGYGTVVFVAPSNAHYETAVIGGNIINKGNATVVLDNLRQCQRAAPDQCSAGIKVHLRPGQSHALANDALTFHRYNLKEGTVVRAVDTRAD